MHRFKSSTKAGIEKIPAVVYIQSCVGCDEIASLSNKKQNELKSLTVMYRIFTDTNFIAVYYSKLIPATAYTLLDKITNTP